MKHIKLLYVCMALMTFLFAACKKDDKTETLTLEKTALTLKVNEQTTIRIVSGNGNYTAKSADESKAIAVIDQNNLKITAKAEGETTVSVSDADGQTVKLAVRIVNLIIPGATLTVEQGSTLTYTLSFGSKYEVSTADDKIATAELSDKVLSIKGVGKGQTQITVKDTPTQKVQVLTVTVINSFAVQKATLSLVNGEDEVIALVKGNLKQLYSFKAEPEGIVTTTVEAVKDAQIVKSENIRVKGEKVGTTKITITDEVSKQTATFQVTVAAAELTVATTIAEVDVEGTTEIRINTGNPGYTVSSSAPSIATAEVKDGTRINHLDQLHKAVYIKGLAAGTATITLKDVQGKTVNIKVTVKGKDDIFNIDADGVVKLKDGATAQGAIKIPDTGKSIAPSAFSGNQGITSVDFNNVTKIGKSAFQSSKALVSITGTKIETIEQAAFALSSITEATLPATVTTIGRMAFMNCKSLTKLTCLKTTPPTAEPNTFNGIKEKATLYVPKGAKAAYEAAANWKDKFKEIKELN